MSGKFVRRGGIVVYGAVVAEAEDGREEAARDKRSKGMLYDEY